MTEIEKLYKLVGVKKQITCSHSDTCYNGSLSECEGCNSYKYLPFTAEKQLELIKWLGTTEYYTFGIFYQQGLWYIFTETTNRNDEKFDKCLAKLINNLWQDLTENEKEEIRKILKE